MKRYITWAVLSAAVTALQAQVPDQIRQAAISGSRGTSGKCTIEVRVDITAEVDVYGDSGRLRTLAGQPATWTRMECTDPLPYSMTEFRFKGIDGRGKVQLTQDPRYNNGMAVIRIDDPRGGAEGYTFAIEWSGASGGAPTGGFAAPASAEPGTPARKARAGFPGRMASRSISAERAIDLCREEVRTRATRDYSLRNVEITGAAADTDANRRGWITGTFHGRGGAAWRRAAGYRFNCAVDYSTGKVRSVEILGADGAAVQPASTSGAYGAGAANNQAQALRTCQDAVVSRTARDGYENVRFSSTAVDTSRSGWITGTITASRGPVTDTFDFGCSMNPGTAVVRDVELRRR